MHIKHSYIIFHLLLLYCNFGESADAPQTVPEDSSQRPAERACQEIIKNYKISVSNYIVTGTKAALGEFPYMVSIVLELPGGRVNCGGSLISSIFVLTAAHCFDDSVPGDRIVVRIGSLEIVDTKFNPETDMIVAERYPYPTRKRGSRYDDIALLRLPRHVNITKNSSPICLETNDADPKGELIVSGWGRIRQTGPLSSVLLKAYFEAVPLAKCENFYNRRSVNKSIKFLTEKQLCAASTTLAHRARYKQDTCQGDSGGPLVVPAKDGGSKAAGVFSLGLDCGATAPKVFTRVSSYVGWIEPIVWPNLL